MSYSVEYRVRIYDDDHGFYWEVRPDADSLGFEIVYNEGGKGDKDQSPHSIPTDAAVLIADAIKRVSMQLDSENARSNGATAQAGGGE